MSKKIIAIFSSILLLALIVLSVYPVQKIIFEELDSVKTEYINILSNKINKEIKYDSIAPSIFGTINIKNISLFSNDDTKEQVLPDIYVKRLRIQYSFFDLIQKKPVQSVKSIKIIKPEIFFNTEKELQDFFVKKENQDQDQNQDQNRSQDQNRKSIKELLSNFTSMLPKTATVHIVNGEAHLQMGKTNTAFSGFSMTARLGGNDIKANLRWKTTTVIAGLSKEPIELSFPCRLDINYNTLSNLGTVNADLKNLQSGQWILHDLKLTSIISDNNIVVQKLNKRQNFNFAAIYSFEDSSLNIDASFNKFNPQTFVTWTNKMEYLNGFQKVLLNGTVNIKKGKESFTYKADLNGTCDASSTQGEGTYNISGSGNEHFVSIKKILLNLKRGNASVQGSYNIDNISARATIVLENFIFTKNLSGSPVSGTILVNSPRNDITVFCDTLTFGKTEIRPFDLILHKGEKGFSVKMQAYRFNDVETYSDVAYSNIITDLTYDKTQKEFRITFTAEAFAMSDIVEIVSAFSSETERPDILHTALSNVLLTTEVFATYNFEHLVYNVPRFITALRGRSSIWASSSISGTEEFASVTNGLLITKNGITNFNARGEFFDANNIAFSLEALLTNSSYLVQGNILNKTNISISSPQGLRANLALGKGGRLAGFLLLDNMQIPLGDQLLEINCVSDFSYETLNSWKYNLDTLNFKSYYNAFSTSAVSEFEAHANQDGIKVDRINVNDTRGTLFGSANFTWERSTTESGITKYSALSGSALLRDPSGEETLSLEVRDSETSFFAMLNTNHFKTARILGDANDFLLTGEFDFFRTPFEAWSVGIDLNSLIGKVGGTDIALSTHGSLDEKSLVLDISTLNFNTINVEFPSLKLALDQNKIETTASVTGTSASGGPISAGISINATFASVKSWLGIGGALKQYNGSISFENLHFDTIALEDSFSFNFSKGKNVFSINGGPQDMMRMQLDDNGDFFASLSTPSPIKGTVVGVIGDDQIDLRTSNLIVNIADLWKYVPVRLINFSGGILIVNTRIMGPLHDPSFFGNAIAASLTLDLPGFVKENIGPTPALITMNGKEMILERLYTTVGKTGACFVSGESEFTRWLPNNVKINIDVPEATPIPLNLNVSGFIVNGNAFGEFNLSKDEISTKIDGTITCDETEITMAAAEDDEMPKEKKDKNPLEITMSLTAGRKVEFLFPNEQLPIIRATAAQNANLIIESDNMTGHFALKGDINVKSGEVFYFQRSFYIREGILRFNESEINFDPRITVRAETRDMTNNGPVTISMVINDQSLNNFSPLLESSPPLSQIEILSLMGEKLVGNDVNAGSSVIPFINSAVDMFAQFYVVRQFEKTVRNIAHIDMFSFRTQALQNAVLLNLPKGVVSTDDSDTTVTDNRIGNYFDNTTVYIGKYITKDLFAQAMISARYDRDQIDLGGLRFEPDLSMEFQAPVFSIRWDFTPKSIDTLVADNKITLTKKWKLP